MRTIVRTVPLALAVGAAIAPTAGAATAKRSSSAAARYPEITRVMPRKVAIGQKMIVSGKHFRAGKYRSTVVFYRPRKPVVFVKAERATTRKLTVKVSDKVLRLFADSPNKARLVRLRVIGYKMSKRWTKNSRSVTIIPPAAPGGQAPPAVNPASALTCQQQAALNPSGDLDSDGVNNATELQWKVDPCLADTDLDGISDGYEYWSAFDLNNSSGTGAYYPYPGKRPWPNPLDPTDTGHDFDGDGLTLRQEHHLWSAGSRQLPIVTYSDGTQQTGATVSAAGYEQLDLDGDGKLTDDERDFDADGLSNNIELNYRGTQAWWAAAKWPKPHAPVGADGKVETYLEVPYSWRSFNDLDAANADTDGDGIPDGSDDQDNDGWSNVQEMQYTRWTSGLRVHPFNPCLPNTHAPTCGRYVPPGEPTSLWPPHDGTVVESQDFEVVRWPWYSSGSMWPASTTPWDGDTGP